VRTSVRTPRPTLKFTCRARQVNELATGRLEQALAEPDVADVLRRLRVAHTVNVVAGPCAENMNVRRHESLAPTRMQRHPTAPNDSH